MANYKPVKIIFDIEDEYQQNLYNHLKKRSNQSSFIRTLLHTDLLRKENNYEVVKEQDILDEKVEDTFLNKNAHNNESHIIQQPTDDEDEFILEGLI